MQNGTPVKDVRGVDVAQVRVSQATRDMANGRYQSPAAELAAEVESLEQWIETKNARKRQIEARLGVLNGRVKGQARLPTDEYRAIVAEQGKLKNELGDILAETSREGLRLHKLRDRLRAERPDDKAQSEPMSPILREILAELRAIRQLIEHRVEVIGSADASRE
jgi:predicted  nucleic acid-binding Zn-ribbon protein